MIKHIVFDFGGVILDLDGVHTGYPDYLATIFQISVAEAKKIWDEHKTGVITGQESPQEFLQRMKQERHFEFDVKEGLAYWEEKNRFTRQRIDWELIKMLEKLKSQYQVHMLTDQIRLSNGAEAWMNEINQHFHTIFRSYEQGFRKPFPEAYQNLLLKIQAEKSAHSVIFIDDSAANIDAANEIGIHGILYNFKNHTLLEQELHKLGVELR